MKKLRSQRIMSLVIVFLMCFSSIPGNVHQVKAESSTSIVEWGTIVESGMTTMEVPIAATGGVNKANAELSHSSGTSVSSTFSSQTIYKNGWNSVDLTEDKYWQIKFTTKTISDQMVLTAKTYGTATSPADFKLVYSIDEGVTFNDIAESNYQNTTTASTLTSEPNVTIALPDDIKDKDTVIIRFQQSSTIAINGTTVASGGNSRIGAISITTNGGSVAQAGTPTANVGSGNITAATSVTLSSGTANGIIYYTTDGSTPSATNGTVYSAPINVESTTTLKAITIAEGYTDSEIAVFNYVRIEEVETPIPISEVRTKAQNEAVLFKGIVTGISGSSTYVQDESGGIVLNINATTLSGFGAAIGSEIQVKGTVGPLYSGLFQIKIANRAEVPDGITVLANPGLPEPIAVTIGMVNTGAYEGMLVKIVGADLTTKNANTGTQNHTVTQYGASCTFRGNISAFNQGDKLEIVGLASIFNSPQVLQLSAIPDAGISAYVETEETIGDPIDVAVWNYASGSVAPIPATDGVNKVGSELTTTATGTLGYASSGINVGGWNNGAGSKYWQAKCSTKGSANITITSSHRSSATGPKDFKLQYSLDGITYKNVFKSEFVIPSAQALAPLVKKVALPAEANNQETLYIRWLQTTNTSANGSAIATGGTSTINYITIAGAEYYGPNDVAPVKASPGSGTPVPIGEDITLSCATANTDIYYTLDDSEPQSSSEPALGPITLNNLPTNIKAVAISKSDPNKKSIVKTFYYTQAKLDMVQANKLSGSSLSPSLDKVKLSSQQQDATISYIVTKRVGSPEEESEPEVTYSQPLSFAATDYPVKIVVKSVKEGYLPSDEVIFEYTAKEEGNEKNYFGQLHSHTAENSDGAGTLSEAYDWAKNHANLDFFAVTDHSNSFDLAAGTDTPSVYNLSTYNADNVKWQNGIMAARNALSDEFVSVYAYEMTWSGGPGHMNTFNTTGFVSRNNAILNAKPNNAGLQAYYDLLKATPNSISQFNHPGPTFGDFGGFGYYDPIIDQRISLIEVGNGEGAIGSGGYFPSYGEYNKALDKGWHLAPTNNQDNHKKLWGDANTARTVIYTNDLSVDGMYEALRDMRVYATEDNNLDIVYTLNGYPLGSIIDEIPEVANLKATIKTSDPARISSVSVISNGGKAIYKQDFNAAEVVFEQNIEAPVPGYYYLKVVEADGKTAVTAPVWLGKAESVGITEVKSSTDMPVTTEELTLSTELFNNEENDITVNSIKYEVVGGDVIGQYTELNKEMSGQTNYVHEQKFTPTVAGNITILVTAEINVNGNNKTYTNSIALKVRDLENLDYIGIDAAHYNEYVNGNYKASMGNFGKLAGEYNARTVELKTSEDFVAALSNPKFKMLVLTAPSRRDGTTGRSPYATYSDAEIAAVAAFAKAGNTVILSGWSDYYENYANLTGMPMDEMMAGQQNKLLAAIGSTLRISDDGALDDTNNGGTNPRLYLTDYNNFVNPLTEGIVEGQVFSHYGGSTIYVVDADGNPTATMPDSVSPIISGHETTYAKDQDGDGFGLLDPATTIPKYNNKVLLTASETVTHGNGVKSLVVASGAAFMSNFEIQATAENAGTLNYSNYNILSNIVSQIRPVVISNIEDIKTAEPGSTFTIEGIATSGVYEGTDDNKGFFDSIYVQDATGGINLFPVSQGVVAGQKIRVTGTISSYQGEIQLLVTDVKVIDSSIKAITPKDISTGALRDNTGRLLKQTGMITAIQKEADGVISQITIDDGSGPSIIYINGYITKNVNLDFVELGAKISAIGLGSIGENFTSSDMLPRLRIRDRSEITLLEAPIHLTGITLSKTEETLYIGATSQLVVSYEPSNAMVTEPVVWITSAPEIATVDGRGNVKAVAEGTALITAMVEGKSATCSINVQKSGENTTRTVTIHGELVDKNGKVLSNTRLELHSDPMIARTDSSGYFTFTKVPFGMHTLYVLKADGSTLTSVPIKIIAGSTNSYDPTTGVLTIADGVSEVSLKMKLASTDTVEITEVTVGNTTIKPVNPSEKVNPNTGDTDGFTDVAVWGAVMIGLAAIRLSKKRKRSYREMR